MVIDDNAARREKGGVDGGMEFLEVPLKGVSHFLG